MFDSVTLWKYGIILGSLLAAGFGFPIPEELPVLTAGVLVGHGDPTLSALPPGQESVYAGAPKLSDLASQAVAAYATRHPGVPISQATWNMQIWLPSWR